MATGEGLRVPLGPTLRPHAQPQASEPHLASFCPRVIKHPTQCWTFQRERMLCPCRPEAQQPLSPYPSSVVEGEQLFAFLLLSFCFSFTKYLRGLGKIILVSLCEDVTLDGPPAGPGRPSVRLETTERRSVSAQRRPGILGADDPRPRQNKLVIVWVLGQAKPTPRT